ncbi:MAG TPA: hypothetical protein VGI48_01630 [Caldimonas sp.]|jgi:hypothetical protein
MVAGVQAQEREKATSPSATVPASPTVTTTTASSMIVVRDKETGALRAATAEEAEKLISSGRNAQAARAPVEPREIRARPGTRAMALGDAGMSTQVVRRNAKGGLDEACVESSEAATKFMSTANVKAHEKVKAHE